MLLLTKKKLKLDHDPTAYFSQTTRINKRVLGSVWMPWGEYKKAQNFFSSDRKRS